jgi:hypothetical protein
MMHWVEKQSLPIRVLVYAATASLAFVLAAGLGAMGALTLRVDVSQLESLEPRPADEQVASQRDEAEYVGTVGEIQARGVETFLESHNKLLQYDALTADDVKEMKANEAALQGMVDQATNLAPPRKYEEQHEVFSAAIDELREAVRLAHGMAAEPVAAELGFDKYDGHVNEASALLQRSNELLGKDYEAIEGVKEISPEF